MGAGEQGSEGAGGWNDIISYSLVKVLINMGGCANIISSKIGQHMSTGG
jgi:hypothetical protein